MRSMYRYIVFVLLAVSAAGTFSSCSDDDAAGDPLIRYVRITKPSSSDSLLAAAGQGQMIAIVGQNLGRVTQLWINDQQAVLSPTLITNTTIITRVPQALPKVVSNKMTLHFSDGKVLEYPFELAVSAPVVAAMALEYVDEGDVATILGAYFYPPLTVTFTGDVQGEVVEVTDGTIAVTVPPGAQPGPVTVKTNFGETTSTFHFRDTRVFLNYDDLNANGSWRPGTYASAGGLDGNYLLLKGKLSANERSEDFAGGGYVSEFWAKANGRPEGNLLPGKPEDYVMKFEINTTAWYGSHLNICFAPWNHEGNNQEYWSNSINARAYWGPWEAIDAPVSSNGWVTVSIPMTDFAYKVDTPNGVVTYTAMPFNPEITGSLTFWLIGSPKANGSPVELHIDNVRIVPR